MKRILRWLLIPLILAAVYWFAPRMVPAAWFSFAYEVSPAEAALRLELVDAAQRWAGVREADGNTHRHRRTLNYGPS